MAAFVLKTSLSLIFKIHRTLLHHHFTVLIFLGMFRGRSILSRTHWDCSGKAAYPGWTWYLVVCGSHSPDNRGIDSQWQQQLVHLLLTVVKVAVFALSVLTWTSWKPKGFVKYTVCMWIYMGLICIICKILFFCKVFMWRSAVNKCHLMSVKLLIN